MRRADPLLYRRTGRQAAWRTRYRSRPPTNAGGGSRSRLGPPGRRAGAAGRRNRSPRTRSVDRGLTFAGSATAKPATLRRTALLVGEYYEAFHGHEGREPANPLRSARTALRAIPAAKFAVAVLRPSVHPVRPTQFSTHFSATTLSGPHVGETYGFSGRRLLVRPGSSNSA